MIRENLQDLRKKRGFSQQKIAFESGISQGHYSDIERGYTKPTEDEMVNIVELLEPRETEIISLFNKSE